MSRLLKHEAFFKSPTSGLFIPTQSLGAEILTNGDFSNGITGWTLAANSGSDPTITATAADGSAGTGGAKYFASAATFVQLRQSVGSVGTYYQSEAECTAYTAGTVDLLWQGTTPFLTSSVTGLGVVRGISRCSAAEVRPQAGGAAINLVLNYVSVKPITLNAERTAASADMDIRFLYTLPASPVKGDQLWLLGRISSFSSGNYWLVLLEYTGSQWNVTLYSVASHTRTSRKSAANVGLTNGLRFVASGTTIRMYTTADGGTNWTQRGTDLTSSTYEAATGYNVMYVSPQVTPGALSAAA